MNAVHVLVTREHPGDIREAYPSSAGGLLEVLKFEIKHGDLPVAPPWYTNSGEPGVQVFLSAADRPAGRGHPLPEGIWTIGPETWAGGADNYDTYWSPGLGPVVHDLTLIAPYYTPGSAFEIHLDANRSYAPGSAGCSVFTDLEDLKRWIAIYRKFTPHWLVSDWGLGSLKWTPHS